MKSRQKRRKPVPRLQLAVTDRGRPRMPLPFLRSVVRAALQHGDRLDMPVSLLLTDDAEIARVHAEFLDDPTPTDVISFFVDGATELVVSVATAARRARELGHPLRAEVALYVVHGILHQCGYDDVRKRDRRRMRAAERAVLATLSLDAAAFDA
jgi:probable rRNA maturation factor